MYDLIKSLGRPLANSIDDVVEKGTKEVVEKGTKEVVENAGKKILKETSEDVVEDISEKGIKKALKGGKTYGGANILKETGEDVGEKIYKNADDLSAKEMKNLADNIMEDVGEKSIPVSEEIPKKRSIKDNIRDKFNKKGKATPDTIGDVSRKEAMNEINPILEQLNGDNPSTEAYSKIFNMGKKTGSIGDDIKLGDWIKDNKGKYDELSGIANKYADYKELNPSLGTKMNYYKIPQKAVGYGTTAFLVSKMFDNKGQQSNSELYGQQTPYSGGGH